MADITTAASVITVTAQGPKGDSLTNTSASFASVSASAGLRVVGKGKFIDEGISEVAYYTEIHGGAVTIAGGSLSLTGGHVYVSSNGYFARSGDINTGIRFDGNDGQFHLASNGSNKLTVDGNNDMIKYESNISMSSPFTASFHRIETETISASTGQFDEGTIYIGSASLSQGDVSAVKEGRSPSGSGEFKGDRIMGKADPTTYIDFGGAKRKAGKDEGTLGIVSKGREVLHVKNGDFDFGDGTGTNVTLMINGDGSSFLGSGSFEWTGSVGLTDCPVTMSMPTESGDALTVTGSTVFTGSIINTGSFDITGSMTMSGDFDITGSMTMSGDFDITGSIIQTGSFDITGSITASDGIINTGSFDITGSIIQTGSFDITGSMTMSGDWDITGSVTMSDGELIITGSPNTSSDGTNFIAGECDLDSVNFAYTNNAFITSSLTASVALHGLGRICHVRTGSAPSIGYGWASGLPTNNGGATTGNTNGGLVAFPQPGPANQLTIVLPEAAVGMSFTFRNSHLSWFYSSVNSPDHNNTNWAVKPHNNNRFVFNAAGNPGVNGKLIRNASQSAQHGDYVCISAIESASYGVGGTAGPVTSSLVWNINTLVGTWEDQL